MPLFFFFINVKFCYIKETFNNIFVTYCYQWWPAANIRRPSMLLGIKRGHAT